METFVHANRISQETFLLEYIPHISSNHFLKNQPTPTQNKNQNQQNKTTTKQKPPQKPPNCYVFFF